ncbi:Urease accessory protein UreF [Solidesulfovibrio fructosivorans JJ]]|uniref:Urease accessory protein UreF n=1 Tax=Solidesulfovibrio fructosivorans JJ] TaxID=596151 RepID=E1JTD4_SOLFR|nr:urease accessory UreF family protein [Solidesulfovibrio fructosivorans]EFL52394.1 Urease accessory protein UreF [Solidesulfovibrio fructosivorans JJ]]
MDSLTLLRLLRLASPALPIGGFAYSQGLEWAVEAGWVRDAATFASWLSGVFEANMASLELPALARMHAAWTAGDADAALETSRELLAWRDNAEARAEERQLGGSLARILAAADDAALARSAARLLAEAGDATYACAFALAGAGWGATTRETLLAFGWVLAEGQTMAAVKLVPLGQAAGQRVLAAMTERVAAAVQEALARLDGPFFANAPGRALAQLRHAGQRVRLFRS